MPLWTIFIAFQTRLPKHVHVVYFMYVNFVEDEKTKFTANAVLRVTNTFSIIDMFIQRYRIFHYNALVQVKNGRKALQDKKLCL